MNIVFFGTPEIAVYCLDKLLSEHTVCCVVTCEDKPKGRHQHMCATEVKQYAESKQIPVLQPVTLKSEELRRQLHAHNADIFVVVAYGKIIPRDIFTIPCHGTINVHPSLLPRYRGAAPIPFALIKGESETGVTVQLIDERLDAGDIVVQEKFSLNTEITAGELYQELLPLCGKLLLEALEIFATGKVVPSQQDDDQATYCGKLTRELARIDWEKSAFEIHNLVRGLNPKPVSWTRFRSAPIKIWKTVLYAESDVASLAPGELSVLQKKRLIVGTGEGNLEILQIQPENKKKMDSPSFINGARLQPGERFEM